MAKTVLQPTQFAIIIGSNGVKELKRGDDEATRAFFLPPYYTVFSFDLGSNGGVKQPVQVCGLILSARRRWLARLPSAGLRCCWLLGRGGADPPPPSPLALRACRIFSQRCP